MIHHAMTFAIIGIEYRTMDIKVVFLNATNNLLQWFSSNANKHN